MSGPIERIVVTLDAASENQAAIETAARLAAHAGASLHGIFVEDEDLLHLASLPFSYQIVHGGGSRPLEPDAVALDQLAAAERARRDFLAAANRHAVTGSFRIVRGHEAGALAEIGAGDLAVAGALTRPVAGHFRVACRWWSSIAVAQGPFLLARRAWGANGSAVALLRDRGPVAERLLRVAAQFAEAAGAALTTVCPPALAGSPGFDSWLAERTGAVTLRIEVGPDEPAALYQLVGTLDCRLLALEAGLTDGRIDKLRDLAERFGCDLLIVR